MKDLVELIYITESTDSAGYPTTTEVKYTVYAERKSVVRSEFYSAMQSALRPKATFLIRAEEWENTRHVVNNTEVYPTKLIFREATYEIIRADGYQKGLVELVVQ